MLTNHLHRIPSRKCLHGFVGRQFGRSRTHRSLRINGPFQFVPPGELSELGGPVLPEFPGIALPADPLDIVVVGRRLSVVFPTEGPAFIGLARKMPLPECIGRIAVVPKDLLQRYDLPQDGCFRPAVIQYARCPGIQAREQRRARGHGDGILTIGPGEGYARPDHPVEARSNGIRMPGPPEHIRVMLVAEQQDHVGPLFLGINPRRDA